ncbi:hypothetical protein F66182_7310 [Fusarium sp. NRRL 66182]|nr:hypothetical protein F66182_7310 [Fusarium sp. NRRL 66182]
MLSVGLSNMLPSNTYSTPTVGPAHCTIECPVILVALEPQGPRIRKCWHAIFQNLVIATGYPILRRNRHGSGLEMPLNLMAGLTMSPRIHQYMGYHILKGYSTALVPSEKLDDMILWHLYYSPDGSRLPYPDPDAMGYTRLNLKDLTAGRHVVGCCSQTKFFAERGWLVNGMAVLLHLLRASVQSSKTDKFKSEFLFQEDKFEESQDPFSSGTVLDVLMNQTNQKLEPYPKEDYSYVERKLLPNGQLQIVENTVVSRTTVRDRVEELHETLEKLIDHNATSEASYKGINAKPRVQTYLKGWDFLDIATDRDPFSTKRAKLSLFFLGWVDLTRAIHAITLFGKGFGV